MSVEDAKQPSNFLVGIIIMITAACSSGIIKNMILQIIMDNIEIITHVINIIIDIMVSLNINVIIHMLALSCIFTPGT